MNDRIITFERQKDVNAWLEKQTDIEVVSVTEWGNWGNFMIHYRVSCNKTNTENK